MANTTYVVRLVDYGSEGPFVAKDVALPPRVERHRLDHVEIVAFTKGHGRLGLFVGDELREFPLGEGRMFLIRPEDQFSYRNADARLRATYVSFNVAEWQMFATLIGIADAWATSVEPPSVTIDPADSRTMRSFHTALERFGDDPTPVDLLEFWLQVVPLFFPVSRMPRRGMPRRTGVAPEWLTRGLDEMRDEANLRVGLARLAQLCHVSPSHLVATTRRYLDATPRSLVMDLRLRHAADLLAATGESVATIATRCGFDDPTYFSTCFRRRHRVSPREYRKSFRHA